MADPIDIYRDCCCKTFPFPSEDDVQSLEERLEVEFPKHYRDFLLRYNGGVFNGAIIVLPEPITVTWRDGLVTHTTLHLEELYGIGATYKSGELGRPSSVNLFDDNDPLQLLPISAVAPGCLLLLDFYPDLEGNVLVKFPSEKAYLIGENFEEFWSLVEVWRDESGKLIPTR